MGVFAFIVFIFYLIICYISKKSRDEAECKDLAKHYNLNNAYFDPNKSYEQNLKKIFSDPEARKEAEENRRKYNERKAAEEDKKRREDIIKRTYSYKYEDVIYEIFAPYRREHRVVLDGRKWEVVESLENEFVIHEISRILNVDIEEARRLFKEFEDNDLIDVGFGRNLSRGRKCSMGNLLQYHWNIISNSDKNFSKWIEEHPNIESVESVNKRRAPYDITERFRLEDFVKKYGDYKAVYSALYSHLYFGNRIEVMIDERSLGIDAKSNQYRLKSVIEGIPNLYVIEDDGSYKLIKV